jgi:hypothetical protein
MCQSPLKSIVCPGPQLNEGIKIGSDGDLRCRHCRALAAPKWERSKVGEKGFVGRVQVEQRGFNRRLDGGPGTTVRMGTRGKQPVRQDLAGHDWAKVADAFVIRIFEEVAPQPVSNSFALCVVGSLGRKEATQFSDLEFCFLLAEPHQEFLHYALEMLKQIKPITEQTGAFSEDKVFCASNPDYMAFTMKGGLINADDLIFRTNILGARCIYGGNPELLRELQKMVLAEKITKQQLLLDFQSDLNDVISKWQGNRTDAIDVKQHIMRPLTWIVGSLGRFHDILGTGNLNHAWNLFNYQPKLMSAEVFALFKQTYELGDALRQEIHREYGQEKESIRVLKRPHLSEQDRQLAEAHTRKYRARAIQCMENISQLVGITKAWMRKFYNDASPLEKKKKCFLTRFPRTYGFYNLRGL